VLGGAALAVLLLAVLTGWPSLAGRSGATAPAVRPGPELLYAAAPRAPQLENVGGWKAAPILVSGATAYRSHEFLYQDHLFDDLGAGNTYRYPTDVDRYANNLADLVELRLRRTVDATVIRLTYNSMTDPALVGTTIALGNSPGRVFAVPHARSATAPADVFVTVHGSTADVVRASTGVTAWLALPARVDIGRRQVTVSVPDAAYRPPPVLRVAAATALWDVANDRYLHPQQAPDHDNPGGAQLSGCPFVNAAFRFAETGPWSSDEQAAGLATCDLSPFHVDVDLRKLAGRDDDLVGSPQGVPTSGPMVRIYASRFELGQGKPATEHVPCERPCPSVPYLAGQLQPYSLHVPAGPAPARGFGVTLSLHSCGGSHSTGPPVAADLANRGEGALVLAPEGRGPCEWYWSHSAADVFEAWADVLRVHRVDLAKSAVTGISMGGYGALKLVSQFPDLFSAALVDIACSSADTGWPGRPAPVAGGEPSAIRHLVASFRNVPVLSANAAEDALCPPPAAAEIRDAVDAQGYRYDWRVYAGGHAPYFPTGSEAAAFFLTNGTVPRDPPHVTLAYSAAMDERSWGLDGGHAHWLSGVRLRDPTVPTRSGIIDVRSRGFGVADPPVIALPDDTGASAGVGFTRRSRSWGPAAAEARADELDVHATNVAEVTVDAGRARVTCKARVAVTSDGPVAIRWVNCPG
jgi:dienelactone hydrolase